MMIDPRTVRIIHQQKEKEILMGKKSNFLEASLSHLVTVLRGWFARTRTWSNTKTAHQCVYETTGYSSCCEEEVYHKLQV